MENSSNKIIYIPDGANLELAMHRTTELCFSAHQDDTEFMAFHAIERCFKRKDEWFTSVILTDGRGSPRKGRYAGLSEEEMVGARTKEQNKAAKIGKYSVQLQLRHKSSDIKKNNQEIMDEIKNIILKCRPNVIYTHNPIDKHPTHAAAALRVIEAVKELEEDKKPVKLIGLEVWRGLDWVTDDKKLVFDVSKKVKMAKKIMRVFDSQIAGGKRYDKAVLARRKANATFLNGHKTDTMKYTEYGIDMSELMNKSANVIDYVADLIDVFKGEVTANIKNLSQ